MDEFIAINDNLESCKNNNNNNNKIKQKLKFLS